MTARSPSGRAATVHITGTEGERDVTGFELRSRLGLRSTWFEISRRAPAAAPPA